MEHYKTVERIIEDDVVDYVTCDTCEKTIDKKNILHVEISYYVMGDTQVEYLDFCCVTCFKDYLLKHSYMSNAHINIQLNKFRNLMRE